MRNKPTSFTNQIRAAIDADGRSRYRICKAASIQQPHMSRFMRGEDWIGPEKLDRLAAVLGLRVVVDDHAVSKGDK